MWRRFVVVEIRISKRREMRFYMNFSFFIFKVINKRMMNLFEGSEDFDFRVLSGWIEKYKPALIKLVSFWEN